VPGSNPSATKTTTTKKPINMEPKKANVTTLLPLTLFVFMYSLYKLEKL
jgi:hypothetical protein